MIRTLCSGALLFSTALFFCACQSLPARVGTHYRSERDHASLHWVAQHWLEQGRLRPEVESMIGMDDQSWQEVGMASHRSAVYGSIRDEPYGHILWIHYDVVDRVESWEWASE